MPGIVDFANEELGQLRADLVADAGRSGSLGACHTGGRDALDDERLDDVADLDVVVPLEADAALEAGLHLGHVVLEAPQRADLALVDDDVVAEQARLRVAGARDAAVE